MSEFISLYSGSSGNSSVVRCGDHYLIIDMGKGVRTTGAALKSLGLNIADCDGILVTHEHSDHVKGLSTFLKKNPLPVYGGADTLDFLDANGIVPPTCELNTLSRREEDIGAFGVQAFPTSHDVPCVGYRIHTPDGKTMTLATDLGVLTPPVHEALSGCDLVALESNYDLHMLRSGPYPYYLRARIESARGHLSNDECSAKLLELVQEGCKKFALCHLSQEQHPDAGVTDRFQHPWCRWCRARERLCCAGPAPQRSQPGAGILNGIKEPRQSRFYTCRGGVFLHLVCPGVCAGITRWLSAPGCLRPQS